MHVYLNWRLSLAATLLPVASFASPSLAPAAESTRQPNVLIITTDQQSVEAMSALGNKWVKTPNLDSLAAQGVYFRRSYTSYPLCSPARASLHTGRPPHEIGVDHNNMAIDQDIPISGQVFHAAGYDTGYAGKWHIPDAYPSDGIPGFEVLNNTTRQNKLAVDVDEATKNVAVEFLCRKRDKPFLLVVSFINPHDICLPAGGSPCSTNCGTAISRRPARSCRLCRKTSTPPRATSPDAGRPRAPRRLGREPSGVCIATPTIA